MWSYECASPIKVIKVNQGFIAVGCINGWIYLFNVNGLLWRKKLQATYYRSPYTDVNINCIDVNGRYLFLGTDWMDGKIYLYSIDGNLLWHKQYLSIMGCWERPYDIKSILLANNVLIVGYEWLNSYIQKLNLNGDLLSEWKVDGWIRDIAVKNDNVIVGTTTTLYINGKRIKLPAFKILLSEEGICFSNTNGVYMCDYNGDIRWSYEIEDPIFTITEDSIIVASNKLVILTYEGKEIFSVNVEKPNYVGVIDENIYLGYNGVLKRFKDSNVEEYHIKGTPTYIDESIIVSTKDNKLFVYRYDDLWKSN